MRKKKIFKVAALLSILMIVSLFGSCSTECEILRIHGKIYWIGDEVNRITFTVTGGTGHYKIYYSRTTSLDEKYARSLKNYVGTCNEDVDTTISVTGKVSEHWRYYVWAVDGNGAGGHAYWEPEN